MPKRRGKSAASKQQKTPKSEIKGAVLISTRYVDGATRSKTDDERFCHNKKKLEAALNAKIICDDNDAEGYPEGMTTPYEDNATGFCQDDATMKKLEKLFNPPSGCIKCKDHTNYTRGMKIVFSAYVL